MADTVPKVAAEERRESLAAVDRKAEALAKQIKRSKHFIVFTGAGISTSAGIPDFRGPDGNWTLRAQGKPRTKHANTLQAIPTISHMALIELQNKGILKLLVSQNCDGLHRRSGIIPVCGPHPPSLIRDKALALTPVKEKIAELHGNSNREACSDCNKEYIRDFRAVSTYENGIHDHRTGRKCARCGGTLIDSIINFGEDLPKRDLDLAYQHAELADLCLVLGSSLTVTPACKIPTIVGERKGAKLAICNLQTTPVDDITDYRIFTETDILMAKLMEKLDLAIPPFILRRRLIVKVETQEEDRRKVEVTGVDSDGTPVTFLRSVRLEGSRRVARTEPYIIHVRDAVQPGSELRFDLEFMGHYNEPNLELVHLNYGNEEALYLLEYDPQTGKWSTERQEITQRAVEYIVLDP
ncbi:silent information regulator family protein [Penicillium brasilianum]|uniref:protein acetyllysine N-acetyltransferase n=1 Tax=Penicillium brasilianum TaxID=104259 RepID=A0A1S9RUB2_PENBI|nr:silent information regulator family protein [Penicillium brasilianum]